MRRLGALLLCLGFAACATAAPPTLAPPPSDAWTSVEVEARPVGLGLPGGAQLGPDVRFVSGLDLRAAADSPFHSLSDIKAHRDGFYAISDAGDLFRWTLVEDAVTHEVTSVHHVGVRRLTRLDGTRLQDKSEGDAEGLAIGPGGDLLVSFERGHRIWSYGSERGLRDPARALAAPRPVRSPDFAFTLNDGMEALSARPGGWRVAGESGGVWDCTPNACAEVVAPPATPLADSDYRITGMDRDPSGDGFFVVERMYRPPVDARARVRRMAVDGALGPVLVELKLPSTTDNFEGIAALPRRDGVRLYILSDDNNNTLQRTLLLVFDVRPAR